MAGLSKAQMKTLTDMLTAQGTRLDGIDTRLTAQGTRLDGIDTRLTAQGTRLDGIDTRLTDQGTRLDGIDTKLTDQGTRLDGIDTRLTDQGQTLTSVDRTMGTVVEGMSRPCVEAMYGKSFAEQCTYETLDDLARVVLMGDVVVSEQQVIDGAAMLAQKIVDSRVMHEYIRQLFTAVAAAHAAGCPDEGIHELYTAGAGLQVFDSATNAVNVQIVKEFMGRLEKPQKKQKKQKKKQKRQPQHTHLLKLLNKLIAALAPGADAVSVLREDLSSSGSFGSLGIAMAQLVAMTPPYVPTPTKYEHIPVPCMHIQCDVRGSIVTYADAAVIKVGEIKRSESEFGSGKKQLQDRLRLLAWATTCLKPTVRVLIRVGTLFIAGPRGQSSQIPLESPPDDEGNHIHVRYVHA